MTFHLPHQTAEYGAHQARTRYQTMASMFDQRNGAARLLMTKPLLAILLLLPLSGSAGELDGMLAQ